MRNEIAPEGKKNPKSLKESMKEPLEQKEKRPPMNQNASKHRRIEWMDAGEMVLASLANRGLERIVFGCTQSASERARLELE